MILLKSCICSKAETDTPGKSFYSGNRLDTYGILPKNSGKSIIYQIASRLSEDMDRDGPVCDGGAEIGLLPMCVSNHAVLIALYYCTAITTLQLWVS